MALKIRTGTHHFKRLHLAVGLTLKQQLVEGPMKTVHYSQLRPHLYNGGLTLIESERLFWKNAKAVDSR